MQAISKEVNDFLKYLIKELEIPDSRYEEAQNRYRSVGEWLCREESSLRHFNPTVHIQGSFGLGTVIKPIHEDEDYDIDMVSEFSASIWKITQKQLKDLLMMEMKLYAKRYSMEQPKHHRRCVRLNYAQEAQFHLDVTPAIPNGQARKKLLFERGIRNEWIDLSVLITDEKHPFYASITPDWNNSNPRGYLKWFHSRMALVFEQRRRAIALAERKSVEAIPQYKVRTPLQLAIQLLKRHRDMTHEGDAKDRPISIIITTLAALAYDGEMEVASALYGILNRMESHINRDGTTTTIVNPTNPGENFADKWKEHPEREQAFFSWLEKAKSDFQSISQYQNLEEIGAHMAPVMGSKLVERAVNAANKSNTSNLFQKLWIINNPAHKQPLKWVQSVRGRVNITTAEYMPKKGGFRWKSFSNNGTALPKNCDLRFEADTNVSPPYQVYWQIVNTGKEAEQQNSLRGGFDIGSVEHGKLKRTESTQYRGTHTIECFIVKDNYCVASSGPFVVNIQ